MYHSLKEFGDHCPTIMFFAVGVSFAISAEMFRAPSFAEMHLISVLNILIS